MASLEPDLVTDDRFLAEKKWMKRKKEKEKKREKRRKKEESVQNRASSGDEIARTHMRWDEQSGVDEEYCWERMEIDVDVEIRKLLG